MRRRDDDRDPGLAVELAMVALYNLYCAEEGR